MPRFFAVIYTWQDIDLPDIWPDRICVFFCMRQDGSYVTLLFHEDEKSDLQRRVPAALGIEIGDLPVNPATDGFSEGKLMFSQWWELRNLVLQQIQDGLAENAEDYLLNYTYAVEEGLDPHDLMKRKARPADPWSSLEWAMPPEEEDALDLASFPQLPPFSQMLSTLRPVEGTAFPVPHAFTPLAAGFAPPQTRTATSGRDRAVSGTMSVSDECIRITPVRASREASGVRPTSVYIHSGLSGLVLEMPDPNLRAEILIDAGMFRDGATPIMPSGTSEVELRLVADMVRVDFVAAPSIGG